MRKQRYQQRLQKCPQLMKASGIDALLLTKPANMFYLTGDGPLCAYAMITQEGKVGLGVPQTDVEDVKWLAHFDHIIGFEDEVGMVELEQTLHGVLKEAGHGEDNFGPPIHGVGIEFEEAPLPPGHAFFHGEKEPAPLEANVVIAVGNCGLYLRSFGVRVEDTVVVGAQKPIALTRYSISLVAS